MYRNAEKQDSGVILQLSLNDKCVGVLDMGSIRDKMTAWVLLAGLCFLVSPKMPFSFITSLLQMTKSPTLLCK